MGGPLFPRVPTEIKSSISVYSLPPIQSMLDIKSPSRSQAPLNISHVCKNWRNIALSIPELWTRICLCLPILQSNWALTGVRTFIERSRNRGLFVRVYGATTPECDVKGWEEWILATEGLLAVQNQWEQVSIRTRRSIWAYGFTKGRNINNLERAQSMEFMSYFMPESGIIPTPPFEGSYWSNECFKVDISNAVNLNQFKCIDETDCTANLCIRDGVLPNLTRLSIHGSHYPGAWARIPTIDIVFKILESVPLLEELDIGLPFVEQVQKRNTVLRIPILRKFVLCVHTKSDLFKTLHQARDFLQYVAFPSLEVLELDLVSCSGELVQILFYLALMLQRSGAQIEVLKLDMTPVRIYVGAVWKFLQRLPSIQDFAGNGALGDFKELLTRLTANTDQAIILPMLRTLSLHDSIIAGAIPEVVALLLSRSPPDGEDYPPQVSGEGVTEDATTGRPLSRSGTSILSEVRIRKRATSDGFSWAGFLVEEGEFVANLHRRGLVINEQ